MTDYADDLRLAIRCADIADAISMDRFLAADLTVSTKPDRSHVTDADRSVEQAICDAVLAERPSDGFYGEEFGTVDGPSGTSRQWIIDPIDGTANFLRGVPVWGTLIALAVDGEPVVGVASCPALGRRWWAASGSGAWTSDRGSQAQPIHVSGVSDLADASLSFQSIEQWEEAGRLDALLDLSHAVWRDRAYGDLWAYLLLAEGLVDIVAEFGVRPYDLAALVPIVQEAGGRFTSAAGESGPWHGSSLATNGLLHEQVLARLASVQAK